MANALEDTIAQSLECSICFSTYTDPKILSCSHTYCKACIDKLLKYHKNKQRIRCPVCRAETNVPNQNVSKLPTNLALRNLIEDMKKQHQLCTNCKSDDNPHAEVYCQDCGKYLCTSCHNKHTQCKDFKRHEVIAMNEISSGKVSVRKFKKCREHSKEDEECFCSSCREFVCFRCVVADHAGERHHQIIRPDAYERSHEERMNDLESKVDHKSSCLQKYVNFIDGEKVRVRKAKKQCVDKITEAYDALVLQLTENKNNVIDEVNGRAKCVDKDLDKMKKSVLENIIDLTTIAGMAMNRKKVPFDIDSLAVHETLCEDLREVLNEEDPDYEKPRKSSKEVKSVSFERNVENDKLELGKIVNVPGVHIVLPRNNSMNTMVCTPDGRMAVGSSAGGTDIISADGQLQKTVLKDVINISGLEFLSDGRCVVLDDLNTITLYTPEYTKMNLAFNTIGVDEGEIADLTVDSDDRIYVSYRKAKKIHVFSSEGTLEAKIPCHGYEPHQIRSYNDSLIISSYFFCRVGLITDKQCVVKHTLKSSLEGLYPAVSQRNTILIAKVNHDKGLVSIGEYTNGLKRIENLVDNCNIQKPERDWYCLQQYLSGEIAFCTPDKLYIFY
ncbi:E3 ubiquitin-protein ligase TRIM31-like [Lytechinus pictus]|uniref:E3 ubiquitin-protein ligase TRIM31-like n=1 Tax=Lytechinus pictus TaxID=7653 RepID=UPI0030B9DB06